VNTAAIYLLRDGETDGPHDDREVLSLLDEREIEPDMLASIEGMKEWRSVKETLVWSHGALLKGLRTEVESLVRQMCDLEIGLAAARCELVNLVGRRGDCEVAESCGTILEVNMSLLMKHRLYCGKQDAWTPGGADLWPAFELTSFGKQRFARDWSAAWTAAGGNVTKGRMVALKNDLVWVAISDFGFPFPPFSLDWSMGTEAMPSDEASEFGLEWRSDTMDFPPVRNFEVVGIL
jgi:hypothetical protein